MKSAQNESNRTVVRTAAAGVALAGVALLLSVGCESSRRGEALDRPVQITNPTVAQGQLVFMAHCNQCHPGGSAGLAPALNDKPLPQALIKFQVRNGLGAMPAFNEKHISDQQLDALAAYVVTLRKADEAQ